MKDAGARVGRRFVVHGRVQGVGFRASVRAQARALGVAGWVRNRPDGAVEVAAEGAADAVAALESYCGVGPSFARVARVDAFDATPEGLTEFAVR